MMTTSNEHNNAPAVPVTCGNGCDCLAQCGDAYAHAGLPKPRQAEATSQGWPFGELSDGQIMATVGRMGELVNYLKLGQQWDGICNLVRQIIRERYTLYATPSPAPAVPDDILARACNLAGLPYETFLKIKVYLPLPPASPAPAQEPYTTIDLGHGKFEVGAGKNGGLPCIAFGRNGTGKVGEPITAEPRQMSVEETFAVITFANVTGLDVLQEKMDQVREEFFPGTTPLFAATPAPAPAQEVATLSLSAEDVHAAFTKNFPKTRISQAWISFAADIAQAIATRAAKPAQEVGLTEAERVRCLIASGCIGTVKMTYDSGPYEITRTSINASRLIDAIISALRAKGGK